MELGNPFLNNDNPSPNSKPRSLICYICGREFGTKSLAIHLKTCEQKWYWEEEKKPKHKRRPLPEAPSELEAILKKENLNFDEIEAYNTQANEKYNNESLVKCHFCNRTFFQERIAGHLKVCTKDRPVSPLKRLPTKYDKDRHFSIPDMSEDIFKLEKKLDHEIIEEETTKSEEEKKKKSKKENKGFDYVDTFVIHSQTTSTTENNNLKITKDDISKKNTESFVKKIKFDKNNIREATGGSPKTQPKSFSDKRKKKVSSSNENRDQIKETIDFSEVIKKTLIKNKGSFARPTESFENKKMDTERIKKQSVGGKNQKEGRKETIKMKKSKEKEKENDDVDTENKGEPTPKITKSETKTNLKPENSNKTETGKAQTKIETPNVTNRKIKTEINNIGPEIVGGNSNETNVEMSFSGKRSYIIYVPKKTLDFNY